ncbi:hypothetical protein [Parabacteroides caecihominis]|uniref:hypothetical protein n=1 Tax=Parabacteroides sp. TA-V-105 TaxID=2949651 RepID=UPI002030F5A5|nr:hypothetical protein [Parabacteroides sp. TA-V-105]
MSSPPTKRNRTSVSAEEGGCGKVDGVRLKQATGGFPATASIGVANAIRAKTTANDNV